MQNNTCASYAKNAEQPHWYDIKQNFEILYSILGYVANAVGYNIEYIDASTIFGEKMKFFVSPRDKGDVKL